MKKLSLLLLLIYLYKNAFSQKPIASGVVIYKVKIHPKVTAIDHAKQIRFPEFQKKINRLLENVQYTLKFNDHESLFTADVSMSLEGEDGFTQLAQALAKSDQVYYVNTQQKKLLVQQYFLGENFLISQSTSDLKWTLIDESKNIGEFTCYKAITQKPKSGPIEKNREYLTYTAWYCPSIPVSFGPFEFHSLPGLIIALSIGNHTYQATQVLLKRAYIHLTKPSKGTTITQKEFDAMKIKAFENR